MASSTTLDGFQNQSVASMEAGAVAFITKAVQMDEQKRFTEALMFYKEGIHLLMEVIKETKDQFRAEQFREKTRGYLDRAERLNDKIKTDTANSTYKEHYAITKDSTGNGYNSVFGRFLDSKVHWVHIDDAYISKAHQCHNFLKFCELLVLKCQKLRSVTLTTKEDQFTSQRTMLEQISASLLKKNIVMTVIYSPTLHDRQIRLSNGWVVSIGRGLDYFHPTDNNCSIGYFDLDLRTCKETNVDIFFRKPQE